MYDFVISCSRSLDLDNEIEDWIDTNNIIATLIPSTILQRSFIYFGTIEDLIQFKFIFEEQLKNSCVRTI